MVTRPTANRHGTGRGITGPADFGFELRQELGTYFRQLRLARGLTQAQLADLMGLQYYTFISSIEMGRTSVPPERYEAFAEALGVDPTDFTRTCLRYQNPWAYLILFDPSDGDLREKITRLPARFATSSRSRT